MLAESIPGGTTTALLVLRALGHDVMVSSASKVNPIRQKEKIWAGASARAGIKTGDLRKDPMKALEEFGDPMQAAVLGFIVGSHNESKVVLAGGTQMLAVAACLRALGDGRPITVATTKYIAGDPSSSFASLASALEVKTYAAPLDFSASPFKGLRDYEDGYVKEGVGAGGSVLYASWNGVDISEVISTTNSIYGEIAASPIN
jgi:NaMN:DMB phosphoribosyltransferase